MHRYIGCNKKITFGKRKIFAGCAELTLTSRLSMSVTMKQMHMLAGPVKGFQPNQNGKKPQAGMMNCREKRYTHGVIMSQHLNSPTSLNPTYGLHPKWGLILRARAIMAATR